MSYTETEKNLEELDGEDSLRQFLSNLNYYPENQEIDINYDDDELDELELRIIASAQGLDIVWVEVKCISNEEGEALLRRIPGQIFRKLPTNLRKALFILSTSDNKLWHFVNYKNTEARPQIRRFVINHNHDEKFRTAAERLAILRVDKADGRQEILDKHQEAFDRVKVSQDFFKDYRDTFFDVRDGLLKQFNNKLKAHLFLQQFINRLMFIYYVQRKNWIIDKKEFVKWLWYKYKQGKDREKYQKWDFFDWLEMLFFSAFNNQYYYKNEDIPDFFRKTLDQTPWLNGELFKRRPEIDEQGFKITDEMFEEIFENILNKYNFTIQEDTPWDQEIAINPEMLGTIFESMVNIDEKADEDEQHQAGIFYTPRIQVDFMCRKSILEYLAKNTEYSKDNLIDLVFHDPTKKISKRGVFWQKDPDKIRKVLTNLKIVDPACGSGAFLVGMIQIITELLDLLDFAEGKKKIDPYKRRKNIIESSLYGVDIKKWAIEVAKLRLWLELLVHADKDKLNIYLEPLLPSLNFKLRVGDSLVQEIDGIYFPVRKLPGNVSRRIKPKIDEIKKLKHNYYNNIHVKKDSEDLIRKKEKGIYQKVIDYRIEQLETEKKKIMGQKVNMVQGRLVNILEDDQQKLEFDEKQEKKLEEIEEKIKTLKEQSYKLMNIDYAFWPVEFSDIFAEKGGFDIVIANPPYIRQEKIADLIHNKVTSKEYKDKLIKSAQEDWDDKNLDLSKRSDLYVHFYLKGLRLLNKDGIFCYISSNSWLDVGYGADLQEFLLNNVPILEIYDNQKKRNFSQADINTIIILLGAPKTNQKEKNQLKNNIAKFVALKEPYEKFATSTKIKEVNNLEQKSLRKKEIETPDENKLDVYKNEKIKIVAITQDSLKKEGLEYQGEKKIDVGEYKGDKWGGKYLRAPEIYWTILKKGKDKLVRLGGIAEVKRGFTTGANDFFYVEDITDELEEG